MKHIRLHEIEEYVNKNDTVSLVELSEKFDVSMNTIRRDVNVLEKNGVVKKVYGGVTSTAEHELTSYAFRNTKNLEAKQRIGKTAADLIEENDLIFIDSGTTTSLILNNVDENLSFTLLTNNLDVIIQASQNTNIELIVVGSRYQHKTRSFLKTSSGIEQPEQFNISKAFMAATGISLRNGLTNSNFHEYEIKKAIASKANNLYVLADSSKFEKSTLLTYAPLTDADKIITDSHPSQDFVSFCDENDIELLISNNM